MAERDRHSRLLDLAEVDRLGVGDADQQQGQLRWPDHQDAEFLGGEPAEAGEGDLLLGGEPGRIGGEDRRQVEGEEVFLLHEHLVGIAVANDPVGYRFFNGRHSVAVATDLGYFSQTVCDAVCGAQIVLLESNHDPDLLQKNPHYPQHLKTRILGRKGHLSNDAGAQAAVRLAQCGTRHLLLGHLSEENNTPDMAYRTTHAALTDAGAEVGTQITLHVAGRYQPSHLYCV